MFVDVHDTSQLGHAILFSYQTMINIHPYPQVATVSALKVR